MNKIDLIVFKTTKEDNHNIMDFSLGVRAGRAVGFNNTLQKWLKFFFSSEYGNANAVLANGELQSSDIRSSIVSAIMAANEKMIDIQSEDSYSDVEKFKNCSLVSLSRVDNKLYTNIKFETEERVLEGAVGV